MRHPHPPGLGRRAWTTLIGLGFVGQLAWTVENMYLNVFVYDTISDDPGVIAAMVAASAVAATLATFVVGAISDRSGRRRGFIAGGYILWGAATSTFGLISADAVEAVVPVANAVAAAVVVVIALDCVMSVFGAGANDAAFQAWVTDITVPAIRGKVESVLAIMPLVSMLVVFGGFDSLAQSGNWRAFFLIIGAIITAVGIAAWFGVRDGSARQPSGGGWFASPVHGLRPSMIRANPRLYLLLSAWLVWGVSTQVFLPYLVIYLQRFLRIEAYPVVLAVVLVGASIVSILSGRWIDRIGKTRFLLPAAGVYGVGLVAMYFARGMVPATAAGLVMMSGFMLVLATVGAAVRDHTPPGRAGHVQGLRMLFAILVPMLIGPWLGAVVIRGARETYVELGVVKLVPGPGVFLAAAAVLLLIAVPTFVLLRKATDDRLAH